MMQTLSQNPILVIGEFGVGKTHFGAQLLKRLMTSGGVLRMDGAASNLEPFQIAMEKLNNGLLADHTPTSTYVESVWPVTDRNGRHIELVWPDYGGEQIGSIVNTRRIPKTWRDRLVASSAWVFVIRPHLTQSSDDIFSRPLRDLTIKSAETTEARISGQARLVELLQMFLYARGSNTQSRLQMPKLSVLLSCWDELGITAPPAKLLSQQLPLFFNFVSSNWTKEGFQILGLSALGRTLDQTRKDMDYVALGPESFGFVVLPDGTQSSDLTIPVTMLM
jgi:hypothetical protein